MTKNYTAKQFADLLNINYDALQKQLVRDSKKPAKERKYPDAEKFGRDWMIPAKYLEKIT